jgi:hypothetical protein
MVELDVLRSNNRTTGPARALPTRFVVWACQTNLYLYLYAHTSTSIKSHTTNNNPPRCTSLKARNKIDHHHGDWVGQRAVPQQLRQSCLTGFEISNL